MSEQIYYFDILGLALSGLVLMSISVYVYYQNRQALVNRVFSALCLFLSLFSFGILCRHLAVNPAWMPLLYKLVHAIGSISIFLAFYFTLIFPREEDLPPAQKGLIFLPAIFFVILSLFSNLMITGFHPGEGHYLYLGKPLFGPVHIFYSIYSVVYLFGAVGVTIFKWFRSYGSERIKLSVVALAFGLSAIAGNLFTLWLPWLGISQFDSLAPISFSIAISLISYSIVKYKLFQITPKIAASDILDSLQGAIIVFDLNGKPLFWQGEKHEMAETEVREIIEGTIARGTVERAICTVDKKSFRVSAAFIKEGGGVVMVFHELTAVEKEESEERKTSKILENRLLKEKKIREVLTGMASTNEPEELDRVISSAREMFGEDPEAIRALEAMASLIRGRIALLLQLKVDKITSEEKLKEIERVNRDGVQRELQIIELRDKIKEAKEAKVSQ